ncbi:hypothetical protein [Xanthomonas sp. D-109]|nr:hypothetical protein [Xanthomonas sp. D-109]
MPDIVIRFDASTPDQRRLDGGGTPCALRRVVADATPSSQHCR